MLYYNNHPYYPNRNKGIELFVVSIITIVTGIYDSRWRVFSRPRLPAIARIYTMLLFGVNAYFTLSCIVWILPIYACYLVTYCYATRITTGCIF